MAISISTHSVPVEPKEGKATDLFNSIKNQALEGDAFDVKYRKDNQEMIFTWTKERKRYTSRMNKDLGVENDVSDNITITNAFVIQVFPKDNILLFSRDRTFKLRSVRKMFKSLFGEDYPEIEGWSVSKNRLKELKSSAEDQGIRTTQVRVKENKNKGAIELDRLTYSDLVNEIHSEVMQNEDVHQEFLQLKYSDILRESNANIQIMLYLNNDRIHGENYLTFNVKVDYGDKESNNNLTEDRFWAENVYYFVRHQDDLPKKQRSFDRFS